MKTARQGLLHKLLQAIIVVTSVLTGFAAQAAEEQDLGRLFNTPQRRVHLDDLRRRNVPIQRPSTTPVTQNIRLDGIVRRSSGPSTVWINGEMHRDPRAAQVLSAQSVHIPSGRNHAQELKVGESLRVRADPPETATQ